MGSVEELCDNITLIDRGKTLLEGRVDNIRKAWAGNEFDLLFEGSVTVEGNSHYSVLNQVTENGKSRIKLKTKDTIQTNEILQTMMRSGNILSFNPALPSMNEIFIRVVEAQNVNIANKK
jgi:ABC-2 type transport system ATP-binding protein